MKKQIWIIALLIISSCTYFIETIDNNEYTVQNISKDSFSILFSHNINGETHPCGCRHHPLGGLPQIAGIMHEIEKKSDTLYVDSGDTFFASSTIPDSLNSSLSFTGKNLARGLGKLKLSYMLPGEQDLAMGWDFLKNVEEENPFTYLVSNPSATFPLNHKKIVIYQRGPHKVFLIALSDPNIFKPQFSSAFISPIAQIPFIKEELKKAGFEQKNPFHRLIALTNSGIDVDKIYAKNFPEIDWIIGSHSQSFTKFPVEEGNTKMVQVLSRNHYLGEIKISLTADKKSDSYAIHESRDEKAKVLQPNPFHAFLTDHKQRLAKIQLEEQNAMSVKSIGVQKYNTSSSCIECHTDQAKKWQQTPHALAYLTLIKAQEENNLSCVKCHSLGLGSTHGFQRAQDIIQFEQTDEKKLKRLKDNYWKHVKSEFTNFTSIRNLPPHTIEKISNKWVKFDEQSGVSHNFSNVQCLNCHDKHLDHPFSTSEVKVPDSQKFEKMKAKCLNCHNQDQSPEWYEDGKASEIKIIQMMKKVQCNH
ncbi:multiheme c-type cytochrome [Halobacteriovorax sp. HLS]|uniref:multiheme c-type cytochrome n=1 Tax=Halobacteriovorax sp. HLS TaxID=2234000 RepID=UPI000FD94639|nr:multiheme c-type cytochrome [Halobacteriovorax sp. HLS]